MVRITKRGITKEINQKILRFLLQEFKHVGGPRDTSKILDKILTPEEQIMIKKRLAIALFLRERKRVKDIREILDVSKATISFVRRGLKPSPRK